MVAGCQGLQDLGGDYYFAVYQLEGDFLAVDEDFDDVLVGEGEGQAVCAGAEPGLLIALYHAVTRGDGGDCRGFIRR